MIDIRELRKESNLSVSELAAKVELSESSCYDLETHPEDIYMTMSIRQVVELMKALNIPPDLLFADSRGGRELLYSIDDWKKCLEQEIEMNGLEQSERDVGYAIGVVAEMPITALENWNLDCLKAVCETLNLDAVSVFALLSESISV